MANGVAGVNAIAASEPGCQEQKRLYAELTRALKDLVEIQCSQIAALKLGDPRVSGFEEEIGVALRAWQQARKAYMDHVRDHGC